MKPTKRTYEIIVEQLREYFLNGDLNPGDKLPSERELASRFNVSRTSIREALRMLELRGAIDIRRGGGSYIKTTEFPLSTEELSSVITKAENHLVYEMLELRRALEAESAYLAAQRATSLDLEKIRKALEQMAASKNDVESGLEADLHFHLSIVNAAHNSLFIKLIHTMTEHMEDTIRTTRRHRLTDPARAQDTLDEHKEIYLAIASGNAAQARILVEEHITRIRSELSETFLADLGESI
ncbi:FadR/GntR family transcriptional regulator [Metabacillus idriensis]|uniref:FadR/GntR family transcriptional regulator n=1 Tax=Metabacillus idriensis TaxID=324768 RepID=UPI002812C48C|nr:FadR/GntR family transcriptional regulator [Metabacillus idriensis]MDR0139548.1 FadR/GntR family transcriptional regulator [Metabacillus idriensis]